MKRAILLALTVTAIVLVVSDGATACPMCARALSEDQPSGSGNVMTGFYYSIIFMLSVPYLLLAGFGVKFYRLAKRAHATTAAEESSEAAPSGPRPERKTT